MCRRAALLLALALLSAWASAEVAGGGAKHSVVFMHEPQLRTEFADVIHPYAFSHAMPDPHYDDKVSPYSENLVQSLGSFVEMQTHVKAGSTHAATLKVVASAEEGQIGGMLRAGLRGFFGRGGGRSGRSSRASPQSGLKGGAKEPRGLFNPRGLSQQMGRDPAHNPATYNLPFKLKKMPSDFVTVKRGNEYRRGSYGLRRRRMPFFASNNPFASVNPFRKPYSFINTPPDMFALRPPNVFAAIKNPKLFDFGRARGNLMSGARFSSFSEGGSSSESQSGSSSGSMGGRAPAGGAPKSVFFNTDAWSDGWSSHRNNGFRQDVADQSTGWTSGMPYTSPVSPYIPGGDHTFFDWYGGSAAGGSAGSESASEF